MTSASSCAEAISPSRRAIAACTAANRSAIAAPVMRSAASAGARASTSANVHGLPSRLKYGIRGSLSPKRPCQSSSSAVSITLCDEPNAAARRAIRPAR